MNTEVAAPDSEMKQKMVDYITQYIPKVHQESLILMIKEKNKSEEMVKEHEATIIELRDVNSDQFNRIENLDKIISQLKSVEQSNKTKQAELTTGLSEVARAKELRAHEIEIATLKLDSKGNELSGLKALVDTVFKPGVVRSEIQRSVGHVETFFTQQTKYDQQGNSINETVPSSQSVINNPDTETKTEHSE